jgi:hypothetical protein
MGQRASTHSCGSVELILAECSSEQELRLLFSVHSTRVAQQWASELRRVEQERLPIKYPNRFYNFANGNKTKESVSADIWRCVGIINRYIKCTIPVQPTSASEIDQNLLNELHGYFERLRGSIETPTSFFNAAPLDVREALQDYNLHIHRYLFRQILRNAHD